MQSIPLSQDIVSEVESQFGRGDAVERAKAVLAQYPPYNRKEEMNRIWGFGTDDSPTNVLVDCIQTAYPNYHDIQVSLSPYLILSYHRTYFFSEIDSLTSRQSNYLFYYLSIHSPRFRLGFSGHVEKVHS